MVKGNIKKYEEDSHEQIARNLLNVGNGNINEAIKTVLDITNICLAYLGSNFNYVLLRI